MKQIIVVVLLLCLCGVCRGQKQFQPDTTINGKLVLENPQSVKAFLPDSQAPEICENRMRPYPFSLFVNKTGTAYLFAYCYEGSLRNEDSAFEIGYVTDIAPLEGMKHYTVPDSLFTTETGIKLGMDVEELIKIKGKDFQKTGKNVWTERIAKTDENGSWLVYRMDAQSDFCRKYGMPNYVMKVRVSNAKINRICFGFEYP